MALTTCHECGKEISTAALVCPNCGSPPKSSRRFAIAICIAASVVLTAISIAGPAVYRASHPAADELPDQEATETQPPVVDATDHTAVRFMTKKLVPRLLKSPATASFGEAEEWAYEQVDDNTVRVKSWVDSQNSFGALIRSYFTAIVSVHDDNWKLDYLKFDDSDDAFGTYVKTPAEVAKENAVAQAALEKQHREQRQRDEARQAEARAAKKAEELAEQLAARYLAPEPLRADDAPQPREIQPVDSETKRQQIADARRAENERERARRLKDAISAADYREWITLGGTKASQAKIIEYRNGVLTLEKRDRKTVDVRVSRLGKADREYLTKWLATAGQ